MRRGLQWCSHGATGNCSPCDSIETPSGPGLKAHRDFLAPRTPEAKWLRTCNPYSGWKLWRDWTPPKPVKVESSADVRKRQLSGKPAGYTWKLWWQHKPAKPTKRAKPVSA